MRFGWLTLSLSPSPQEDAARIDQQIEQVCFAEQLGFSDVWLTEHYFTGESVYNDALLFASAVAMRTERIRIGFAVVQLPFHHPVRLAVQRALLDNLSKGPGSARARSTTSTNLSATGYVATTAASGWRSRSISSDAFGAVAR
jgi:Luciferase-like monooxygenase